MARMTLVALLALAALAASSGGAAGQEAQPGNPIGSEADNGIFLATGVPKAAAGAGAKRAKFEGAKEKLVASKVKFDNTPAAHPVVATEDMEKAQAERDGKKKAEGGAENMSFLRVTRRGDVFETTLSAENNARLAAAQGDATSGQSQGSLLTRIPSEGDDAAAAADDGAKNDDGDRRRYVFTPDGDNRARIYCGNEGYFPRSAVVQLTTASGVPSCSGTLVGPRHVLTAAHCVKDMGPGGAWKNPRVVPRRNCYSTHAPFGVYTWSTMYVPTEWTTSYYNWGFDYAIIVLSVSPNAGWMAFGWTNSITTSWGMTTQGYQMEDKPAHEMYWAYRSTLKSVGSTVLYHYNDIVRGSSGSSMFAYWAPSRYVIYGVVSYQSCPAAYVSGTSCYTYSGAENGSARIRSSSYSQICGWIGDSRVC